MKKKTETVTYHATLTQASNLYKAIIHKNFNWLLDHRQLKHAGLGWKQNHDDSYAGLFLKIIEDNIYARSVY